MQVNEGKSDSEAAVPNGQGRGRSLKELDAISGQLRNRCERQVCNEARNKTRQRCNAGLRLLRIMAMLLAEVAELAIDLIALRGGSSPDGISRQRTGIGGNRELGK